ncbi:MAG: nucleotidyltransferase family protein [Alphaproteobacteria bacterium]|nr:nucleotidyltransferase family protein [Alphaproteobacteria bacterium]
MSTKPDTAMILAAGLGMRMRPLTDRMPKPMVPVGGKPMIDYALDSLHTAGIGRVVVNVHHMADKVIDHLARRSEPETVISDETNRLLDSGGGIVKALPLLGEKPFFILNADTFWCEQEATHRSNLSALAAAWNPQTMDILIMTTAFDQIVGYDGNGDFLSDETGRLRRFDQGTKPPLVYPGVAILHPAIFDDAPEGPFSLNACFDRAIARKRLHGIPASGLWLTVGTPEAIDEAEAAMHSGGLDARTGTDAVP